MRKKIPLSYFFIFFALLAILSLPKFYGDKLRGTTIAVLTPAWQNLIAIKSFFSFKVDHPNDVSTNPCEELERLRLNNTLLQEEINHLKQTLLNELRLIRELEVCNKEIKGTESLIKKRHLQNLHKLLSIQLQAVPAKVIFRSPSTWSSFLWINVGYSTNEKLGTESISKNSPVLIGNSIIGVVDFVGKKQSRVRLITDSGLTPSVRVLRESDHDSLIREKIYSLIHHLTIKKENSSNAHLLLGYLDNTLKSLSPNQNFLYLAKGEIHGSSKPLWSTKRHHLKGIGFNYDFADGEGPARDLRTGKTQDHSSQDSHIPILKVGDLLVTTGMDGVFPKDLLVAKIITLKTLKEGDYYYELEALPTAGNLDEVNLVFVIPPLGYDSIEPDLSL